MDCAENYFDNSLYFFAVDDRKPNLVKLDRTYDIMRRLRIYNTGRIHEELKYFILVDNPKLKEKCMKLLKNNQVLNNEQKLKKIIDPCFCNYDSAKLLLN